MDNIDERYSMNSTLKQAFGLSIDGAKCSSWPALSNIQTTQSTACCWNETSHYKSQDPIFMERKQCQFENWYKNLTYSAAMCTKYCEGAYN